MRLVFLGSPGSGKGTQARKLAEKFSIPTISTGNILRNAVNNKTSLGIEARHYLDCGELVPDHIVIGVVQNRLNQPDCQKGYILDGFPRTIFQAESFAQFLSRYQQGLTAALNLEVSDQELINRMTGRRSCMSCQATYHIVFSPSKKEGICDRCGGVLIQRDDDKEETIKNRLQVYQKQTAPLALFYQTRGLLKNVNGVGEPGEVFNQILKVLEVQ